MRGAAGGVEHHDSVRIALERTARVPPRDKALRPSHRRDRSSCLLGWGRFRGVVILLPSFRPAGHGGGLVPVLPAPRGSRRWRSARTGRGRAGSTWIEAKRTTAPRWVSRSTRAARGRTSQPGSRDLKSMDPDATLATGSAAISGLRDDQPPRSTPREPARFRRTQRRWSPFGRDPPQRQRDPSAAEDGPQIIVRWGRRSEARDRARGERGGRAEFLRVKSLRGGDPTPGSPRRAARLPGRARRLAGAAGEPERPGRAEDGRDPQGAHRRCSRLLSSAVAGIGRRAEVHPSCPSMSAAGGAHGARVVTIPAVAVSDSLTVSAPSRPTWNRLLPRARRSRGPPARTSARS